MGVSPQSLLVSLDMKGMLQGNERNCNANGYLWRKVLEAQAKRRWQGKKKQKLSKRSTRILMKRRARLHGSRKRANGVEKRVRTLKRLIPNSESRELDGLFRETADYILSLQMRVRVMQVMVNVLNGSDV